MKKLVLLMVAMVFVEMLFIQPAVSAKNPYAGKKVIEFGFDIPSTEYVRKNIRQMEKYAFDGVTLSDGHGWRSWSRNKLDPKEYEATINNLKATEFKRFTDNFIPLTSYFPPKEEAVDWFDPEWSSIAYNAGLMARAAKEGGLKGILFDAEQYGDVKMWDYDEAKKARPFEEYRAKAKERGREFMTAINKEYPDITILVIWAYELPVLWDGPYGQRCYILLAAFLDGMCEAATPGTNIVDGYEYGYGDIAREKFQEGRKMVMETAKNTVTTNREAFSKHVSIAFPVYPDHWDVSYTPIFYDKVEKNIMTPAMFRAAVANALAETDKYVWVYTERIRWWDRTTPDAHATAPKEYIEALAAARQGPGDVKVPKEISWMDYVVRDPFKGWKFTPEESSTLDLSGWHRANYDDSKWQTIDIGDPNVPAVKGNALYRIKLDVPKVTPGKRSYLSIGTTADKIYVWLSGRYVGMHDMDPKVDGTWKFFSIEVTDQLKPGEQNVLAVRTYSKDKAGGLTKPSNIMSVEYTW